jgi:hypothetical protein
MSVLLECSNLIIKYASIEDKYPGGITAFEKDVPNSTFCTDRELARVGFMDGSATIDFMYDCMDKGIPLEDMATFNQVSGFTKPENWLTAKQISIGEDTVLVSLHVDGDSEEFVAPAGWKPSTIYAMQSDQPQGSSDQLH